MDIIHKIAFFDFLDAFFTDVTTYKRLSNKAKMDNYFMTMRTLSIINPIYTHIIGKIQNVHILDALQKNLGNLDRKPSWVFTSSKGIKEVEMENDPFSKFDKSIINAYSKHFDIDIKDFKLYYEHLGDDFIRDIDFFIEENLSQTEKPKNKKRGKASKTTKAKKVTKTKIKK